MGPNGHEDRHGSRVKRGEAGIDRLLRSCDQEKGNDGPDQRHSQDRGPAAAVRQRRQVLAPRQHYAPEGDCANGQAARDHPFGRQAGIGMALVDRHPRQHVGARPDQAQQPEQAPVGKRAAGRLHADTPGGAATGQDARQIVCHPDGPPLAGQQAIQAPRLKSTPQLHGTCKLPRLEPAPRGRAPLSPVLWPDTAGDPGGRGEHSIVKGLQSRSFYPV